MHFLCQTLNNLICSVAITTYIVLKFIYDNSGKIASKAYYNSNFKRNGNNFNVEIAAVR